jgi:hypothetical protein
LTADRPCEIKVGSLDSCRKAGLIRPKSHKLGGKMGGRAAVEVKDGLGAFVAVLSTDGNDDVSAEFVDRQLC